MAETSKPELSLLESGPTPAPENWPPLQARALTICLPRATAACTFLREPSFSSNTSADQMAQLTCVHSFCPMYRSRPASWGQSRDVRGGVREQTPQPGSSCSTPHLRVRIPVFEAERTLTGVLQM